MLQIDRTVQLQLQLHLQLQLLIVFNSTVAALYVQYTTVQYRAATVQYSCSRVYTHSTVEESRVLYSAVLYGEYCPVDYSTVQ